MSFFIFRASDMATLTAPVTHPDLVNIQENEIAGTLSVDTASPTTFTIPQTFTNIPVAQAQANKQTNTVQNVVTTTQNAVQNQQPITIVRSTVRYGCSLCPGFHCDRKSRKSQDSVEPSLEKHIQQVHPARMGVWETLGYRWGRRVKYSDGRTVDEPEPGSAPSIMDPGRPRSTRTT